MLDAVRGSNASADPKAVASWLVHHAMSWIPASCWVVIAPDMDGEPAVLAEDGLTATLEPAAWTAARWVLHHGVEFLTGDLATDPRTSHEAGGSVVAFPLSCRHRTVGALVGVDQQPSRSAPALGAPLATALAAVGPRVLVVDLDPQGNASTGLGIPAAQREFGTYNVLLDGGAIDDAIMPTAVPNLSVMPATVHLLGAELELIDVERREYRLADALARHALGFDYILIDCPPALGLLTLNALVAADEIGRAHV